ncbi:MAG: ATP-dependent Clp protease protease subunit [Planctomycetota bacterium]|jgi:ATP-dependent Clp protease protease subunit
MRSGVAHLEGSHVGAKVRTDPLDTDQRLRETIFGRDDQEFLSMTDNIPVLDECDKEGKDKKDASPAFGEKLLKSRTIIASKGVDDELATSVIAQLLVLEQDDPDKPITVIVNSPGGSADSGFAIYDAMRFVKCPIRSIVMGLCASAGVMIFLGGDEGSRFATPTARFLLHQPSMRTMGQASDLQIVSDEIDRLKLVYNQIVADASGKTLEEVNESVARDFWLSAQESVEYGFVDKVVSSRQEIE